MTQDELKGVWFIYDGDCPICNQAVAALRIKQACGPLHLVNARTDYKSRLVKEVNKRGYDLDEGMVIIHSGKYYHGSDALQFMARNGAPKGIFNKLSALLFKNKYIARLCYPMMRSVRNFNLRLLRKKPIHNLIPRDKPIFQPIFKDSWDEMPTVMHKHYANRPYCRDVYKCKGSMQIRASKLLSVFGPISHFLGGIPIANQSNISVKVTFKSDPDTPNLHFVREFFLTKDKPYIFHSTMVPQGKNKVTEVMRFGLCWQSKFSWENNRVILSHNGYCMKLFGMFVPLPLTWLIGHIHAEEEAKSDTKFNMFVEIRHWLFGTIYEYRGDFEMESGDA